MNNEKTDYKSIGAYIINFPEAVQKKLTEMRDAIREEAPQAQEKISYKMPTFDSPFTSRTTSVNTGPLLIPAILPFNWFLADSCIG